MEQVAVDAMIGTEAGDADDKESVTPARAALLKRWEDEVASAKAHWEAKAFKRMRDDMAFARGDQWGESNDERYVANLTMRHIQMRVAAIYARNPTVSATRRNILDFEVWDGEQQSLMAAMQQVQQAVASGMEPPAQAVELLQDVENGKNRRSMIDRIGKTLELVFRYSLDEPQPRFKTLAKQLIRRVETCGVGYVKLGYQRIMQQNPETESRIQDVSDKLRHLEMLAHEVQEGELFDGEADMEEFRLALKDLQAQPEIIVREGLVFDFPKATQIIVDPACIQLQGFIGAGWVAHEFIFTPEQVEKIYGVDVKTTFTAYTKNGTKTGRRGNNSHCCVWEVYDFNTQMVFTICQGHKDFLKEPASPELKLEQFHPFFVLTFNDLEDDECIFPPSDVRLIRPMQVEHNRAREGLREHRISNRPAWITPKGALEGDDKAKLASHDVNELLELSIDRQTDVRTVLQPKPNNPIDPAVYDTAHLFEDMQRTLGNQEANFGGTSGATATESSIAENSRVSSVQSNIDDLDSMFTELARAAGQVLLLEMSADTVKRIAGPGAVWPEMSRSEVAEELYLEIKAGSSGRPNKSLRIANLERVAPYIIQTPGLNPEWWLKKLVGEVDDDIDVTDAILAGIPSIVAMNANQQPGTGDASTDPRAQGGNGGNNSTKADGTRPGAQAAYPGGDHQQQIP